MFFLPLFDNNPTSRTPVISYLILVTCIMVFFWQLGLSGYEERTAFLQFGIIPSVLLGNEYLPASLVAVPNWATIFTSMFLHGGFMHLAGNMLYLWIFSDNVEDSMGSIRFIVFYALCGVGAGLCQAIIDPGSNIPIIGASGGIAGILGAYILLHPRATVRVFMLILVFVRIISLPAWLVLGVWIAGQFVAAPAGLSGGGGVAYFAHIAGFITGMALIPLFKRCEVKLLADDRTEAPRWSAEPVPFSTLKQEAKARYQRQTGGSVPSVKKAIKGPWD